MYFHPSMLTSLSNSAVPIQLRDRSFSRAALGKEPAMQKLLVPFDGSPASICAVEYVIAHRNGAKVHLVNVQPPIMVSDVNFSVSEAIATDVRLAKGGQTLRAAIDLLDAHDIEHTAEVVLGSPAEAIVRCAAERRCTKIVMGTKGRSAIANLLARSVASRVVTLARVPVTLIKEGLPVAHSLSAWPARSRNEITRPKATRVAPVADVRSIRNRIANNNNAMT